MATTYKNTVNSAKNNILSNAAFKYAGLIVAFIGLVVLLFKRNITSTALQLGCIAFVLIGLLLFTSNLKALFTKKNDKNTVWYMLLGLIFIAIGILLYFFGGTISVWIDLIVGIIITLYGLIVFIYIISKKKNSKSFVLNLIMALLLITSGVMITLMYEFSGSTYLMITGIISSITGILYVILN